MGVRGMVTQIGHSKRSRRESASISCVCCLHSKGKRSTASRSLRSPRGKKDYLGLSSNNGLESLSGEGKSRVLPKATVLLLFLFFLFLLQPSFLRRTGFLERNASPFSKPKKCVGVKSCRMFLLAAFATASKVSWVPKVEGEIKERLRRSNWHVIDFPFMLMNIRL